MRVTQNALHYSLRCSKAIFTYQKHATWVMKPSSSSGFKFFSFHLTASLKKRHHQTAYKLKKKPKTTKNQQQQQKKINWKAHFSPPSIFTASFSKFCPILNNFSELYSLIYFNTLTVESLVFLPFLPTHMFVYFFSPYLPKLQREVIWVDWWSNWGTPEILYERGFRCLEVLQACHFLCKPSVFSTQDHAQGRCSLSSWLHLQKATSGVKFLPQNLPDTSKQPPFLWPHRRKGKCLHMLSNPKLLVDGLILVYKPAMF